MSFVTLVGTVSSFQRRKYDVFYWKIDQFSELSEKAGDHCLSPKFYFKGQRSFLNFYPNGMKGLFSESFGLYFLSYYDGEPSSYHLTLGLKTRTGKIEKRFSGIIFSEKTYEVGSSILIRRTEFFQRKEELAPSDCLTFVAFLHRATPEMIRDVADTAETGHAEENVEEEKEGNEKVAYDMGKLLASGDGSDATVVIGEEEFKVHSCILAARTPVFAALFEHNTIEKETRKITIMDCEPDIFKEFLNHLYTGSVQKLTAENSLGLYQIADKYLVKDLKKVCRQFIVDNWSLEIFCGAVQLALRCGDEDLLQSAIDYCATNYKLILRSVEWQRYIKENPREANEILIKSLGPL